MNIQSGISDEGNLNFQSPLAVNLPLEVGSELSSEHISIALLCLQCSRWMSIAVAHCIAISSFLLPKGSAFVQTHILLSHIRVLQEKLSPFPALGADPSQSAKTLGIPILLPRCCSRVGL